MRHALRLAVVLVLAAPLYAQQVTFDRILHGDREPQNWLSYSGTLMNQRFSPLTQITAANVKTLQQQWVWQARSLEKFEATPLVVDGVMYTVQAPNDVVALDAATGRPFWTFAYTPAPEGRPCCGRVNRGLAILGDTLYMGTIDAHLIAIDAKSGKPLWNTVVAKASDRYSITSSPTIVKDKVIIGTGGGDGPIRGFISAFDAKTGKELWRFYTIPGAGEPGNETWSGDSWKTGGVGVWNAGAYDPEANLVYFGTGNPAPDWDGRTRLGDNLYSDSVVALDADNGRLKWHYQFTPHDRYDYDSVQVPVLADITWRGAPLKAMIWANRNGNFYVLERETGKFLIGKPFVKVNWMDTFDERGRPHQTPQPEGQPTWPGNQGGTNWYSPSYSPHTGLFYVPAWEGYASIYKATPVEYQEGRNFGGGVYPQLLPVPGAPAVPGIRRGPINNWTEAAATGAVLALDAGTGELKWKFPMTDVTDSGILTTASDVLFTGGREGYFQALDARTGSLLWKASLGAQISSGPVTYEVDGKQYVTTISGLSLCVFGLRE